MAIPPLQANGTLPPGEYHTTLSDLFAAFPSTTPKRQMLNQVLQDAVPTLEQLRLRAPDMIVYVDGSYVASEPDPSDLDLLIRSDDLFGAGLREDDVRAMIWQGSPAARQFVDVFLDHIATGGIFALLTQTRTHQVKGIVILDL